MQGTVPWQLRQTSLPRDHQRLFDMAPQCIVHALNFRTKEAVRRAQAALQLQRRGASFFQTVADATYLDAADAAGWEQRNNAAPGSQSRGGAQRGHLGTGRAAGWAAAGGRRAA